MYDLNRFLEAQAEMYDIALAEIQDGCKIHHWIWFIFPQLRDLGSSEESVYYGISNLEEAKAYLKHPILGKRLKEVTKALLELIVEYISDFFSYPDDVKLLSSMTLFSQADPEEELFRKVIERFYDNYPDRQTLQLLKSAIA